MKVLSLFVLLLLVATFTVAAQNADKVSTAEKGSFITLKQRDGREFRVFVAGPADANAAILIVHDHFGMSDATKQKRVLDDM